MILSVLVPMYGVEEYIPSFLNNIKKNLENLSDKDWFNDIEFIFLDDKSPDKSRQLVDQWILDNKSKNESDNIQVKIIENSTNLGLTKSRAVLLAQTQAEYIWYIDPDDEIDGDAMNQILSILKDKQPDVLLFNYEVFYHDSNTTKYHEQLNLPNKDELTIIQDKKSWYRLAILDDKHYFWNKVFKRNKVLSLVEFDIVAYEDIAYTPIWLYHCESYYYLNQSLIRYRIHENSITKQLNAKQVAVVQGYLEQAEFCADQVKDDKSHTYLLYKAYMYYFRLKKNLQKNKQSVSAEIMIDVNQKLQQQKQQFPQSIYPLLKEMRYQGMTARAIKLWFLNWRHGS
ncbi:glycosyltransferase family 2 protein [Psychrobacter sp. I-STPA10]|uniref:glycosyltransferase family 2 protein n=1 Tax=Psychrobacter sp. I-STPA10 TaxID=2585769 RepID=UPI001E2E3BE9|nr:glycosyltransferase family 2 protein [Psychrobacter sp. I-STPA10]